MAEATETHSTCSEQQEHSEKNQLEQDGTHFDQFLSEVKSIEERDSVLTAEQQIFRLTKQGASYFNLNPYEVLQVSPETESVDIKKIYKRLSILIHPDKNLENREKAQLAFEALTKAYKYVCLRDVLKL